MTNILIWVALLAAFASGAIIGRYVWGRTA